MNVICLLVLQLSINTWAYSYFDLGHFPHWADDRHHITNSTITTLSAPSQSHS